MNQSNPLSVQAPTLDCVPNISIAETLDLIRSADQVVHGIYAQAKTKNVSALVMATDQPLPKKILARRTICDGLSAATLAVYALIDADLIHQVGGVRLWELTQEENKHPITKLDDIAVDYATRRGVFFNSVPAHKEHPLIRAAEEVAMIPSQQEKPALSLLKKFFR